MNKYSVLMSVYYKESSDFLKISIDSMLNQTIFPDEFILVKDGTLTDELNSVINTYIEKYPELFTILSFNENRGLGPSLASGIEISRNEFIARMDSDDYSVPNRCQLQLEYLNLHPDVGIVGSNVSEFINTIDNVISDHLVPEDNDDIYRFMKRRCAVIHPTVMFKKGDVLKSGNYRKLDLYEDYDLFSRMIFDKKIKAYNIQEILYFVRTSLDFFKRRGGLKYGLTALKFKYRMYRKGYMSILDFAISGFGQFFVCCLPNKLREFFYNIFLRK